MSFRFYGSHRLHRLDHTDHTDHTDQIIHIIQITQIIQIIEIIQIIQIICPRSKGFPVVEVASLGSQKDEYPNGSHILRTERLWCSIRWRHRTAPHPDPARTRPVPAVLAAVPRQRQRSIAHALVSRGTMSSPFLLLQPTCS